MPKTCQKPACDRNCYGEFCLMHKPRKPLPPPKKRIAQQSDKEKDYQVWKETVARPYLIKRDGNNCACCKRPAASNEKLDIEHTITKGSRPDIKRDLDNMTLMDRICHYYKTIDKPCPHKL